VVVSAQVFHWVDRAKALAEAHRVLRPGGTIAIWWKLLMAQDPVNELRGDTFRALGVEPPASGLTGGFREFYASPDFMEQTLRVIPWRTSMPLEQYVGYERSRRNAHQALGEKTGQYVSALEKRLRERFGEGNPTVPLGYVQYLYLAKKR
jgi:SAM-dependent methyltransferase